MLNKLSENFYKGHDLIPMLYGKKCQKNVRKNVKNNITQKFGDTLGAAWPG